MKTRKQYMDGKVSHQDYYAQFVNENVKNWVLSRVGTTRLEASCDEHLNDIPLRMWDDVSDKIRQYDPTVLAQLKMAGDGWSLAGGVCIAKAAARIMLATLKTV